MGVAGNLNSHATIGEGKDGIDIVGVSNVYRYGKVT